MQLSYIFSEVVKGLRRNLSMTIAVVVTISVSLTLVGMGLLLNSQAIKAENYWGSRLQITVFMCTDNSQRPQCVDGKATADEKLAVEQVLNTHPEVASWHFETAQDAYDKWRSTAVAANSTQSEVYSTIKPSDFPESYWVTLNDPNKFQGVESQVQGLPGVATVRDLRQVLDPIYFWISALKGGRSPSPRSWWWPRSSRSATRSGSLRWPGAARSASCAWWGPRASTSSCRS